MDRLSALLAPLVALLSGGGVNDPSLEQVPMTAEATDPALISPPSGYDERFAWLPVSDSFRLPSAGQVRIEQGITIRITPRRPVAAPNFADLPPQVSETMIERPMPRCLPIGGIAAVQVSNKRLLLFMRDRRIVSLGLEKSCRATDFYSGFYLERTPDGQLCADRDRLQSRSGANCAVTRMRRLVEE